ncbi:DUF3515 family protein [Sinomonas sp. ASV322]|uniref:DUF3515 family protein n=1 Tax=Sinomonas sp. ASV322 TaxID=3041920 RepID=UPI0027DBBDB2|nr:DUF3515 family protein [Sinomonas sp. ASV322]MDQ4502237.1 DUF3515 family protein [Sinomonas sp. ASV322]
MTRSRRRAAAFLRASAAGSAAVLAVSLAACSAPVSVDPAPDAANPACAPEMIALPDSLGTAALRKTTSQATAAWGDPAAVVLRCGVPTPGPTTDRCVTVNGVDWVIREASTPSAAPSSRSSASGQPSGSASAAAGAGGGGENGTYILTTFGRKPATELLLDSSKISSATVLATLSAAVSKVPQTAKCVGQAEVAQLPNG